MSEELSGKGRPGWGGARANSGGPRDNAGGARPNAGGARPNSGGARPNTGGARPNTGGARLGAGRPSTRPVLVAMPFDIVRWFCVRAKVGEAKVADEAVRLAGFEVFNPSVFEPPTKPRRDINGMLRPGRPARVKPAFGRFFFVSLNLSDPGWRAITGQQGVKEIMGIPDGRGGPGIPIAIPDRAIERIRGLCAENDCIYPRGYALKGGRVEEKIEVGTAIRLTDTAFDDDDVTHICEWSDRKSMKFIMNILGREVPVTVKQSSVQIAA